jgi:uncharacterized protein YeaO (DUF488 family)
VSARIATKRVYDAPAPADGYRVLIDRLWPRGISRERAKLDEWARELAPSTELRRWFGHDPDRFGEFRTRYRRELEGQAGELDRLRERARAEPLTLLYGARDTEHNDAVVLAEVLSGDVTQSSASSDPRARAAARSAATTRREDRA